MIARSKIDFLSKAALIKTFIILVSGASNNQKNKIIFSLKIRVISLEKIFRIDVNMIEFKTLNLIFC